MNCYNGEDYVGEAIQSVIDQTYKNWELIIWDNKSTDSTYKVIKKFNDKRIRYFLAKKFTKLGEARNLAIKKSKGSFIAFLDCDDLFIEEKLAEQIELFKDSNIGIVISNTLYFNNKGKVKKLYKNKKPPTGNVFKALLSNYFISLESVMIRKKALNNLTYIFDVNFEVIEEYDLLARIAYKWELGYVDKTLSKWRVHNQSWTWKKFQLFPLEKMLMLKKFSNEFFEFDSKYKNEIKTVKKTIALEQAIYSWSVGDRKESRNQISPYAKRSVKFFIFYLLTFFNFRIYTFIQKLMGGVRPE